MSEEAKNEALLFFLDHLMSKSGRRTIHDLSCQFGARGFSDQMKEAVGGTQEALVAFLAQHPALFIIDGDEVSINQLGTSKSTADEQPRARDAETEAIQFFVRKLEKFGPEMPIKSLLGHRSQAQADVRNISGRHLKDFVDFLHKHSQAFIVTGDRVRLARMPEPNDPHLALGDDGLPLAGARAKQAAVDYLKEYLEGQDEVPVPLENLYQKFCDRFPHVVRQDVATNPKELLAFLKLNRAVFFIRSNKVSIVRPRLNGEDGQLSSMAYSSGDDSPRDEVINTTPQITSVKSLPRAQTALSDLLRENLLVNGQHIVAFDCKFVALGPNTPEFLSLVVVGTPTLKYVVFDVAHSDTILLESGLKELLQSYQIVKVMHDAAAAAKTLMQRYGMTVNNVFDTQVAHTLYQHARTGKALHEIRSISFTNLQRVHHPQSLMSNNVNVSHQRAQMNWAHRPLTDDSLIYIAEQAVCLVPTMHNILSTAMPPELLPLFVQMCADRLPFANDASKTQDYNALVRHPPPATCSTALPTPVARALQQAVAPVQPYKPPMVRQKSADLLLFGALKRPCCHCACHSEVNNNSSKTVLVPREKRPLNICAEKETQTIITGDVTPSSVVY